MRPAAGISFAQKTDSEPVQFVRIEMSNYSKAVKQYHTDRANMSVLEARFVQNNHIEERIERLKNLFPDDVENINYHLGEDWSGDPALFLSVQMSEVANDDPRFRKFLKDFPIELLKEVRAEELGVHAYPTFIRNLGL